MIHEEVIDEKTPPPGHHSKFGHMFSTVLNKMSNWVLDGPRIRTFHPFHMELIKCNVEDLEEREKFAKV